EIPVGEEGRQENPECFGGGPGAPVEARQGAVGEGEEGRENETRVALAASRSYMFRARPASSHGPLSSLRTASSEKRTRNLEPRAPAHTFAVSGSVIGFPASSAVRIPSRFTGARRKTSSPKAAEIAFRTA